MIPAMHKAKYEHRWSWNLQQRQGAYAHNLQMWIRNKNRLAKRIEFSAAHERRFFTEEFGILDRLVAEAVAQCNVEDDQIEFYKGHIEHGH